MQPQKQHLISLASHNNWHGSTGLQIDGQLRGNVYLKANDLLFKTFGCHKARFKP